jgi:large subunit ribosomal protein L23
VRKLERRKPCVHGEPGLDLRPYQVILRPLVTEKGTHQSSEGKKRRFRQGMGQLPRWKKAVVTLHTDDKIEFF